MKTTGAAPQKVGKQLGANARKGNKRARWGLQQGLELSRLLLGFARFSKRLPDAGDRSFWQLCYKHFDGEFTCRQVQAKVRYLGSRFRRLADGAAKTVNLGERDSINIWTQIMRLILPTDDDGDEGGDVPDIEGDHLLSGSTAPSASISRSRSPSPPPFHSNLDCGRPATYTHQADWGTNHAFGRAYAKGKRTSHINFSKDRSKKKPGNENRCSATEYAEAKEGSGCSTEVFEEVEVEEEGVHVDDDADAAPKATPAAAAADHHHDNNVRMNIALLHHVTVADLASAVKTLADVVARDRPGAGSFT